jgi:hypothetical protein
VFRTRLGHILKEVLVDLVKVSYECFLLVFLRFHFDVPVDCLSNFLYIRHTLHNHGKELMGHDEQFNEVRHVIQPEPYLLKDLVNLLHNDCLV